MPYVQEVGRNPNNYSSWNELGKILIDSRYTTYAIFCFEQATKLGSNKVDAWINNGKALMSTEKYQAALFSFEQALNLDSDSKEAWINKGHANSFLGRYGDALVCYDKASGLKSEPNEDSISEPNEDSILYFRKANVLFYLKRYEEALGSYKKSLELKADEPLVWVNEGLTLNRLGKFEEAEHDYKKALELDGENISAIRNLAYLYSDSLFLYDKALDYCKKLYAISPNPDWTTYLAETYIKVKSFDQSRYYSKKAIHMVEDSVVYGSINRFFIVCSYILESNFGTGIIELQGFMKYYDKNKDNIKIGENIWVFKGLKNFIINSEVEREIEKILFGLIDMLEGKDNFKEVKEMELSLGRRINNTSDDIQGIGTIIKGIKGSLLGSSSQKLNGATNNRHYLEGDTLSEQTKSELGYLDDSIQKLDLISRKLGIKQSGDTKTELKLANLMIVEGKYEQAIGICDDILHQDPRNIDALGNKGIALYRLEDYEEANKCYDRALKIDSSRIDILVNRGLVLRGLERNLEANDCFVKAVSIQLPLSGSEALLYKGIALRQLERFEEAIASFDEALASNPTHDRTLVNKGISLDNLGRHEEAQSYYERALMANSNSVLALYNKARSLSLGGKVGESLRSLKQAIELDRYYINKARIDQAFKHLEDNQQFRILVRLED